MSLDPCKLMWGSRASAFPLFTIVYVTGMLINAALTDNPFSAVHAGTGDVPQASSVTWTWHVGYLFIVSSIVVFGAIGRFPYRVIGLSLVYAVPLLLSGALNGALAIKPESYAYDIAAFTFVSIFAAIDARREVSEGQIRILAYMYVGIVVGGFALALLKPEVWGMPVFTFKREVTRGEVTAWVISGLPNIMALLAVAYLGMRPVLRPSLRTWLLLAVWLFVVVVLCSMATRTDIYLALAPLAIYALVVTPKRGRNWALLLVLTILGGVALLAWPEMLANADGSWVDPGDDITTGRYLLWVYYGGSFLESPWYGQGAYFLERATNYLGAATSEVGILRNLAEGGLLGTSLPICLVAAAVFRSFKVAYRREFSSGMELLCAVCVLALAPELIQGLGRILTILDFWFWYSCLYILWRKGSTRTERVGVPASESHGAFANTQFGSGVRQTQSALPAAGGA